MAGKQEFNSTATDASRDVWQSFSVKPGGGLGGRHKRAPGQKPKHFAGTLRRLWHDVKIEKKPLAFIFVFILIDAILAIGGPLLIGFSIDIISQPSVNVDFNALWMILFALAAVYIGNGVMTLLHGWIMAGVSQRIVARLRQAMFDKLQKLPLAYYDARRHGEIMSRLANDIDNVSSSLSQATTQLMTGFIAIAGSLVVMLILSPILTLVSLLTVPLVYFVARTITQRTGRLFKEQQIRLGQLNGHVEETITGMEMVKAFNQSDRAIREFDQVNERLYAVGLKAQTWSGSMMPFMNVINHFGFACVALAGGVLAIKGLITVGTIASFITYSKQFVRPLNELANMYNVLLSGVAGAERVFEVLDEEEESADSVKAIELIKPRGHVVFADVSFGYRADAPILKQISFEAAEGSSTAIVGSTGAGKTTIINLLTRFYDTTAGHILIDGHDIRDYTRDSLRDAFGIVLQDTYLFSGTIKENIRYGKPEATDEDIVQAARLANAHPFIARLSHKYDTILTENGGNLSQGERQLLALARVMLRQPSILILDEATSSIDTRTEIHIQEALLQMMKGRTSFIIAHRLNTIRAADVILVIEQGEIVERGNHEQLMNSRGRYYDMFYQQIYSMENS